MLLDNLKRTYLENKDKPPLLLRNTLKETIQFYILDFIGSSVWGKRLVMKGGTCLRFCFGLPRLSEDLDFDIEGKGDLPVDKFGTAIKDHFVKTLKFSQIGIKLANNKRTIYLKFPVLRDLGFARNKGESDWLHVRIDLAPATVPDYLVEISLKSAPDFSFLIRRYSLPDLFAGKINAILTREKLEGKVKTERFKGRDFYDLVWFLEKGVKPNWQMVKKATGLDQKKATLKLKKKISRVTPEMLKRDLLPFFFNPAFVENFAKSWHHLAGELIKQL